MAHVLTDGEKTTQRMEGQWSKSRLIVPEYHTIYTARLASVPASADMVAQIAFNSGSGTLSDVRPDMMLYVGTSAGAYDLGMCRIRKAPISGTLYIGETSEIVWQANAYLTVVDDYSLWQKSLRIVSQVPYMDWDVAYSDQHDDFDPVPVMGSDKVAKLKGDTVDVTLGAAADTPAWILGSTISSHLWVINGAVSIDDNTAVNPVATFDATGTYLAYCTFTAANGKTFTGVRYIVIWDDGDPHLEDFQIRNGRINYETGACSFEVVLFSGFERATLRERSKVILASEDFAGTQAITLPGPLAGSENIVCIGWISEVDTSRQAEFGEISFRVESAEFWMKKIRDYPSGLELRTGAAAAWTDMPSLTVRRACWHFLHWRSTSTRVMDVLIENDTRLATRFVTMRANLWERVEMVAKPTIHASMGVDHLGRLFVQIDPQMISVASRTFPVVMTLTDDDILDEVSWRRRDVKALSMLFYSGISVDSSGVAASYFAMSPGHSYGHHGEEGTEDRYLVASQASAEEHCGLYYGWKNNDPYGLEVTFVNSMRIVGMWPRQYFYYEVSDANDPRGIGYAKNFIVREIGFEHDVDTGFLEYSASLEPAADPGPAVKGDIPTFEDVDFSIPDLPSLPGLPALPDLPIIYLPPTQLNPNQPKKVVLFSSLGVYYTVDFDSDNPSWLAMNNGLSADEKSGIVQMCVTPAGFVYILTKLRSGTANAYESVYRAALGGSWTIVQSWTDYPVLGVYDSGIRGIGTDPTRPDRIAITGGRQWSWPFDGVTGAAYITFASNGSVDSAPIHLPLRTHVHGTEQPLIMTGNGNWTYPYARGVGIQGNLTQSAYLNVSNSGAELSSVDGGWSSAGNSPYLAGALGLDFIWVYNQPTNGYRQLAGLTESFSTDIQPDSRYALALSPTGTHAMGASVAGTFTPYKTTDSGATWSPVSGVIPIGSDVWENCRDNYRWIFGGGIIVRLTMDQGATYHNKSGNLGFIAPLIDVDGLRYIE
jgi:hypothetical protein